MTATAPVAPVAPDIVLDVARALNVKFEQFAGLSHVCSLLAEKSKAPSEPCGERGKSRRTIPNPSFNASTFKIYFDSDISKDKTAQLIKNTIHWSQVPLTLTGRLDNNSYSLLNTITRRRRTTHGRQERHPRRQLHRT